MWLHHGSFDRGGMSFTALPSTLVQPSAAPRRHPAFGGRVGTPAADFPAAHLRFLPWHLLQEARPPIVAIFAVRVLVGSGVLIHFTGSKLLLLAGWLALTVAAYVFNGMCDLDADRINGSHRPLATGQLGSRTAGASVATLAVAGVAVCWAQSRFEGVAGIASLAIGWAYSAGPALKRHALACCVSVGAAAALTYLVSEHVAGVGDRASWALVVWSVWIAGASAVKDLSDVVGDADQGRRTLAVVFGPRRAAGIVACVVFFSSIGLLVTTLLCEPRAALLAWVNLPVSAALIMSLLLVRDSQDSQRLRRPYRLFMAAQFAVNGAVLVCMA